MGYMILHYWDHHVWERPAVNIALNHHVTVCEGVTKCHISTTVHVCPVLGMVGSGCDLVVSIALGLPGVVRERPALRMALRHHVGREASGPYGTGIAIWGERPVVRVALRHHVWWERGQRSVWHWDHHVWCERGQWSVWHWDTMCGGREACYQHCTGITVYMCGARAVMSVEEMTSLWRGRGSQKASFWHWGDHMGTYVLWNTW